METFEVLKTHEFEKWFSKLRARNKVYVASRLDLLSRGHFGDHKRFQGLIELRWRNGLRVYAFIWGGGNAIVVALNGGDKNGQKRDIQKAKKIRDGILEGARPVHK